MYDALPGPLQSVGVFSMRPCLPYPGIPNPGLGVLYPGSQDASARNPKRRTSQADQGSRLKPI
jgi:hypothetical protein